jgi:hypothetical protein
MASNYTKDAENIFSYSRDVVFIKNGKKIADITVYHVSVTDTNFDIPELPLDSTFKIMVNLVKLYLKVHNIRDTKHLL